MIRNAHLASDPEFGRLREPSAADTYRFRRATALMIAARLHCLVPVENLEDHRRIAGGADWPEDYT